MRLSDFVGQEDARLALALNAVDPRCGGLLLAGGKGCGKSTLGRLARGILPEGTPFVELPLNVTEDSLLGGMDLEATLRDGVRTFRPGILSRAHGGVLFADDINLLPAELLALLLEARERGEEIIERDGFSERRECRFVVVATMNTDEGELSPHVIDRFGLCAVMKEMKTAAERCAVMRFADGASSPAVEPDPDFSARVAAARAMLPSVAFPPGVLDYLSEVARRNVCPGHRGDLFLHASARACAALEGAAEVTRAHVDRVAPLVFAHRALEIREEEPREEEPDASDRREDEKREDGKEDGRGEGEDGKGQGPADPGTGEGEAADRPAGEGERDADPARRESSSREEILGVGTPFRVRRLVCRKDRRERRSIGRRTKTRTTGRGGRHVKTVLRSRERDIAIEATLRACAPHQKARGRSGRLIVEPDDLRFRRRERKMRHLVVFVVDGSGSMGAQQRMVAAKGAVQSLLMDCYRKRDRVAMIVFRKDGAELVLPPTSSVALASRRLAVLPVGGKTPLAAGLLETLRLVERVGRSHPEERFLVILVTDGRGNCPLPGSARKDQVGALARLLAERPGCDFVVVDTENKGDLLKADLALELARHLDAAYCTIDSLKAGDLSLPGVEFLSG